MLPTRISLNLLILSICLSTSIRAGDWPTWRYDAQRTGRSPEKLPDELHLQWVRLYPPLRPAFWQVRQERVQFDQGYEPIVLGKTLLFGSSQNDRLTALDVDTGAEKWRFYTDGPVRLAPVGWQGKVYAASDDGCLYCLEADTGKLLWTYRAVPSERRLLGNGRLISVWPARGGPVLAQGKVYFAAGVWPFEGIFVTALDAATGKPVWINDRGGALYLEHPHSAMSFGGPSPQGYLLIRGNQLVVPSSRAFPAFFDLDTGKLLGFDFGHGGHGSRPGGWFVATDPDGRLVVDPEINTETHDAGQQVIGQRGVRRLKDEVLQDQVRIGAEEYRLEAGARSTVTIGGREYRFAQGFPGVQGTIHSILAADGKLFVVTREGSISCFGPEPTTPKTYDRQAPPLDRPADSSTAAAGRILDQTGMRAGYAMVLGLESGRLAEELACQSDLHVIAVDPDVRKVDALRRRLDRAGLYGTKIVVHAADPLRFALPPYLASLIVSEDCRTAAAARRLAETAYPALRPYGGTIALALADEERPAFDALLEHAGLPGAVGKRAGELSLVVRAGPLPGATDYTGQANFDELVRAPLGLLWFGDTFHHHKLFYKTFYHEAGRGLPTTIRIVDGVLKYTVTETPYGPNRPDMSYHDYLRFLERHMTYREGHTDIYTGRVLAETEPSDAAGSSDPDEPVDPRAPSGDPRLAPIRTNPLTGLAEGREFLKTYGCDRSAVDYGYLLTMRSGTAAYYDKRVESGTINISGIRSGCRNSLVPAGGVLCLPSWTGNCTCNYPVYTSLALAPMPAEFEQWSAWGEVAVEAPVRRIGINLGAPGDRATEDGTLWLDYPSVGGPSPQVPVEIQPAEAEAYYRHALWIEGGQGWPWVVASGLRGVRRLRIAPVALRSDPPGRQFSVRWLGFLKPPASATYTFAAKTDYGVRLWIGDKLLLDNDQNLRRGSTEEVSASIALDAGVRIPIRMEYFPRRDGRSSETPRAELRWSTPSMPKAILSKEHLVTADGQPGGLTGLYYDSPDFSGPAALQVDPQIDLHWGSERPGVLQRLPRPPQLPARQFTVRLFFAEPEDLGPGQRLFSVKLQGQEVLTEFNIVGEAGGPNRGVVREFKGIAVKDALEIELVPSGQLPAVISGVELIETPGRVD